MKNRGIAIAIVLTLSSLSLFSLMTSANDRDIPYRDSEPIDLPETNDDGFFTENLGQWNDEFLFIGETPFGQIGLGKRSVYFNMKEINRPDEALPGLDQGWDPTLGPMIDPFDDLPMKMDVRGHVVKYTFEGSNDVVPFGVNPKKQINNYFLGNDPDGWVRGVRNFETVVYEDLYDNIDLNYYFSEKGAKYDLILNPYADPENINIKVDGQRSLDIENGNLDIGLDERSSIQDKDLVTYQDSDQSVVSSNFKLIDDTTYGFDLGHYDNSKTHVIDPLIFSTYLGSPLTEYYAGIVEDSAGDVLVLGSTWSAEFPVTTGAYDEVLSGTSDIVVTKMESDGSDLIWATYVGGTGSTETGVKILADDNDDVFIIARTYSSDFPITTGAFDDTMNGTSDISITKLTSDGSDLLGSTFIGGSGSDSVTSADGFGINENGNLVMSIFASISSPGFPVTSGAFDTTLGGSLDIAVFEMKSDCTDLVFSTFVGGSGTEGSRFMEIRPNGEICLGGYTSSTDFPVSNDAIYGSLAGATDIFFFKLKSDGSNLTYSTFIGGSGADTLYSARIGEDDYVYMTGTTSSTDFPTTNGQSMSGSGDFFVVKIKSDLSGLVYGRLIGGSGYETQPISMGITDFGEVIVSGGTISTDFPTTSGAFDTTFGGGTYDRVVFKFSSDGANVLGSTYFGGIGLDYGSVEVGPNGEIYLGGSSNSSDLPTTDDADDPTHNGETDLYFVEFNDLLTDIEYSSYYGGTSGDSGSLYMNPNTWNIFLSGSSNSNDFPTTSGAYDSTMDGTNDMVIMKVLGGSFGEPLEVYSVESFSDVNYQSPKSSFDIGEVVFIELQGLDSDVNRSNSARVNISFGFSPLDLFRTTLRETGNNTGIYRGSFIIPPGTIYCDTITVYSRKDPTKLQRLFIEPPYRPSAVSILDLYSDPACTIQTDKLDKEETGYVKIIGVDANPATINMALANLTSDTNLSFKIPFVLQETGQSSGIYIGSFKLPPQFDYFDNFTINSVRNEALIDTFMIHTPVQIRPLLDNTSALEDVEYRHSYWNFGYETATWSMDTVANWLSWDDETKEIFGTPNNNHVGAWDVLLTLEDGKGHDDEHEFTINVENTPPNITVEPLLIAVENQEYYVDFDSTDDGQGDLEWTLIPDRGWLGINENSGELRGTPSYDDVGILNVSVTVKDGHEGSDSIDFQLTIIGVNDPPKITSLDIKTGKQGENYYRKYEAHDPDGDSPLVWSLETDATFLTMDTETGVLQGTPGKFDVGDFLVNVTVTDPSGANSTNSFTLTIEDINDMPDWLDVPEDTEIIHGQLFKFDVNATDPDPGGFIEFSVTTVPETDMEIGETTGELTWIASVVPFTSTPYELDVTIKATDGELFNRHDFTITIIPTESPTSTIWGPDDGEKVSSQNTVLEWEGTDPEEETLTYDIYLHENQAYVVGYREESVFLLNYDGNSITTSELDQGKTYYWTVIPYDGGTHGICETGVRSFIINNRPTIPSIQAQEVMSGKDFSIKVSASDNDVEDSGNLVFTLTDAPTGMTIKEDTGVIRWKPSSSQEGVHTITVEVSDGVETTIETFDIEVLKGDGGSSSMMIIIIGVAVILVIIIVVLIFLLVFKKGKKEVDPECVEVSDADDESAQITKEMEARKEEKDWENELIKSEEQGEETPSVHLSVEEAHASDKDRTYDKPTYQEIYGQAAPEIEEGDVSVEDIKSSLREAVDEIQNMDQTENEGIDMDDLVSQMQKAPSDIEANGQETEQ